MQHSNSKNLFSRDAEVGAPGSGLSSAHYPSAHSLQDTLVRQHLDFSFADSHIVSGLHMGEHASIPNSRCSSRNNMRDGNPDGFRDGSGNPFRHAHRNHSATSISNSGTRTSVTLNIPTPSRHTFRTRNQPKDSHQSSIQSGLEREELSAEHSGIDRQDSGVERQDSDVDAENKQKDKEEDDTAKEEDKQPLWYILLLILVYAAADISKISMQSFSLSRDPRINVQSINLAAKAVDIAISLIVAPLIHGMQGLKDCFMWKEIARNSGSSAGLAATQAFHLLQMCFVSGGDTIIGQLRLPFTALLNPCFLGKKYSINQWIPVIIITLGIIAFAMIKGAAVQDSTAYILGMTAGGISCVFAVGSFLLREKFMKDTKEVPFYIQNFHFNLTMLVFHSLLALLILPGLAHIADITGFTKGKQLSKKVNFFTYSAMFQCRHDWDSEFEKMKYDFLINDPNLNSAESEVVDRIFSKMVIDPFRHKITDSMSPSHALRSSSKRSILRRNSSDVLSRSKEFLRKSLDATKEDFFDIEGTENGPVSEDLSRTSVSSTTRFGLNTSSGDVVGGAASGEVGDPPAAGGVFAGSGRTDTSGSSKSRRDNEGRKVHMIDGKAVQAEKSDDLVEESPTKTPRLPLSGSALSNTSALSRTSDLRTVQHPSDTDVSGDGFAEHSDASVGKTDSTSSSSDASGLQRWHAFNEAIKRVNKLVESNPWSVIVAQATLFEIQENLALALPYYLIPEENKNHAGEGSNSPRQSLVNSMFTELGSQDMKTWRDLAEGLQGRYSVVRELEINQKPVYCRFETFKDSTAGKDIKKGNSIIKKDRQSCFIFEDDTWKLVEIPRHTKLEVYEKEENANLYWVLQVKAADRAKVIEKLTTPSPDELPRPILPHLDITSPGRMVHIQLAKDQTHFTTEELIVAEEDNDVSKLRNRWILGPNSGLSRAALPFVYVMRGLFAPGNKHSCGIICDETVCKREFTQKYPNNVVGSANVLRPVALSGIVASYSGSVFRGWDWTLLLTILAQCSQMWMAGIITKQLSGVYRTIGQVVAVLGLFFVVDLGIFARNSEQRIAVPSLVLLSLITIIIAISILNFMVAGQAEQAKANNSTVEMKTVDGVPMRDDDSLHQGEDDDGYDGRNLDERRDDLQGHDNEYIGLEDGPAEDEHKQPMIERRRNTDLSSKN